MTGTTTIIDLGLGNVGSIVNMFRRLGVAPVVSSSPDDVRSASLIVLPGVGAFDAGMRRLVELDLVDVLTDRAIGEGVPTIGLCLGMQLMTKGSEEGSLPGLGWLDAQTSRFRLADTNLKVPHMGWNTASPTRRDSLFRGADPDARYYFVHSYHVDCGDTDDVLAWTNHGANFASAVQRGSVMGTQFHPEKSHRFGMHLLANFVSGA